MKLVSITFANAPRLPGLRPTETGNITCDTPYDSLKNWRAAIRGSQLFFISPPGWQKDRSLASDPKGPVTVFGPIPLSETYLQWQLPDEADIAKLLAGKMQFDSPPFGWTPTPIEPDKSILAQIPAGQMGDA